MRSCLGRSSALWAVPCLVGLALAACSESVELRPNGGGEDAEAPAVDASADATAQDASGDAVTADAPGADAEADSAVDADSPFRADDAGRVQCGNRPCACDNGIDDDGDGTVDGNDAECTGAYDDDEASFATGIPGDNIDFCQDCFFDGNSGMGDDGCARHSACLYGQAPPGAGNADCFTCEVSDRCRNFCLERTPNGCDCFGCCEVRTPDGETLNVLLADTCTLDDVDDVDACPPCTPSSDCNNDCGRCELCPGKDVEDLPADCEGEPSCADGVTSCDADQPCPSGSYCQLGCCLPRVL